MYHAARRSAAQWARTARAWERRGLAPPPLHPDGLQVRLLPLLALVNQPQRWWGPLRLALTFAPEGRRDDTEAEGPRASVGECTPHTGGMDRPSLLIRRGELQAPPQSPWGRTCTWTRFPGDRANTGVRAAPGWKGQGVATADEGVRIPASPCAVCTAGHGRSEAAFRPYDELSRALQGGCQDW